MRKTLLLAVFTFVFIISSCSSDDNDSGGLSGPKISSIHQKRYYNGSIDAETTFNFNYSNNILDNVTVSDDSKVAFTYSGNKITSTNVYYQNVLQGTWSFTYSGDNLVTFRNNIEDEKAEFTYSDGKLISKVSSYLDGDNWVSYATENYIFNSDLNLQQKIWSGTGTPASKLTYEYDNRNNPFKNMNPYLRFIIGFETLNPLNANNSIKDYEYSTVNSTIGDLRHNYQITYNAENYPISIKKYLVYNNVEIEMTSELTIIYIQ